jgi:hypothetical protein
VESLFAIILIKEALMDITVHHVKIQAGKLFSKVHHDWWVPGVKMSSGIVFGVHFGVKIKARKYPAPG